MAAIDDRPGPSGFLPEHPSTSQTSSISAGHIMPSTFASCTSGSCRNCSLSEVYLDHRYVINCLRPSMTLP